MSSFRAKLKGVFFSGVKAGWRSYTWICKITLPISFLVAILHWAGLIERLDFLLEPVMNLINLPAEAALPIISGMLINIYAVIGIITVLPFSLEQMTLIAVFCLIAHNLILEGIIQHKSGLNLIKTTLIRIAAAVLTVLVISQFFGDTSQSIVVPATDATTPPFLEMFKVWALDMLVLLLKILGIIMLIMITLEAIRSLRWQENLLHYLRPLVRVLGLSEKTGMMWVAAAVFGLLYSGASIVEEFKKGELKREEMEHLHISIGVNHSMTEDPVLFMALGLNAFWLWVPRFIMAILVVQSYRATKYLKHKLILLTRR